MRQIYSFLSRRYTIIVLVFLIAFSFRIPLLHTEFVRTQDSVEYINIAENLVSGRGFITTIKPYLIDENPVIAPGNLLRPPLAPLLYAIFLAVYHNYYFLQFVNIFLSSLVVVLTYLLTRTFVREKLSFLAAVLIALNPYLIVDSRFIISEQLFYCLVLSFFLIYFRMAERSRKYVCLGVLAGLAYLTRIEGILLLAPLFLLVFRNVRLFGLCFIFFVLICLPSWIWNYQVTNNFFHSSLSYHFSVLHYTDIQEHFYRKLSSPLFFIQHNYPILIQKIMDLNNGNLRTLLGLKYLSLLSIIFVISLLRTKAKIYRLLLPLFLFLLFDYIVQTASWAVASQPERHLALIYILLIVTIFSLVEKTVSQKIVVGIVGITLVIYLIFTVHSLWWVISRGPGGLYENDSDPARHWIKEYTDPHAIIATHDPWTMYLVTGRPSIMLPREFPSKSRYRGQLRHYIHKYDVRFIYLDAYGGIDYLEKEGFQKVYKNNSLGIFCVSRCK